MTVKEMRAHLAWWRARQKLRAVAYRRAAKRLKQAERRIAYWETRIKAATAPDTLSVFGIDYAWGKPNYDALKAAGVKFVMRYISHDPGKDLGAAEYEALRKRGIRVGLVFETTAQRALGGYAAGRADAEFARSRLVALGLVKGATSSLVPALPVYFAVDWDVTPAQKPTVNSYLAGAASVLGKKFTGVYGGYHVVKYVAEHGACGWFWQTYAWSGGLVHSATHVHQYSNGHTLGGVSCDFNHAKPSAVAGLA